MSAKGRSGGPIGRLVDQIVPLVLDAIDINSILDRVDVDRLIKRIDVDAILDQIDVEKLLGTIDINEIIENLDIERLLENVDIAAMARQADIGTLVAQSTQDVAGSTLDLARRQLVGLDSLVTRFVMGLLRRDVDELPPGPELLIREPEPAP